MAACSFGALNVKVSNLNWGSIGPKVVRIQPLLALRTRAPCQFTGLAVSRRLEPGLVGSRCSPPEVKCSTEKEDGSEESTSNALSPLIPSTSEVESLLTEICETSSIAEFELKVGGFQLYVARDLTSKSNATAPPASAPLSIDSSVEVPDRNGSVSSLSLAIIKPEASSGVVQTLLDRAADEGLVILNSPKVGYFRRSRTIKGKRAPPSCKEKQTVKEGQVICYIEQIGGEIPIESDVSGEVIKILRQDGEPVGYGDALIAILPSFPGIKKLQ